MSERGKHLAERFTTFNHDMISFVESCAAEDWKTETAGEQWSVGVVARHVAAGHYGALDFAEKIVAGEPLPDLTMDVIDQMNASHAKEHAECTKSEVLALLREKGSNIAEFLEKLSEEDLDRTGRLALAGGDISTQQFIERVIIQSGRQHLNNMESATGKS